MNHKEKNANILPSCKRQLAKMLNVTLWCFTSKVANCGEPLLIVGLQCDSKCVDGMHHIVLESVVKLPNNIQMKKGLTFAKYVESINEIENQ
jgi:hypothetical protein